MTGLAAAAGNGRRLVRNETLILTEPVRVEEGFGWLHPSGNNQSVSGQGGSGRGHGMW